MTIWSRTDIVNWVEEHIDLDIDQRERVVDYIQDLKHPGYGCSWTKFLNGLTVEELLEASEG